jgi:hypothetical protein
MLLSVRRASIGVVLAVLSLLGGVELRRGWAVEPSPSAAATAKAWIGKEVVIESGTTIGEATKAEFALADLRERGQDLLLLTRRAGATAGAPTWTVIDVLAIPPIKSERRLVLAVCGTRRSEGVVPREASDVALDPEIVAIARASDAPVLTSVEQAWRANRRTGKFEPVAVSGVVCLNDREEHP